MTAEDHDDFDVEQERANIYRLLTDVTPGSTPGTYVGHVPDDWEEILFGGCVIGQAITAVTREAPEGARLHSLHAYFLRPSRANTETHYRIETIRDGRAYSQRRLFASQDGKAVFEAMCSFTTDGEGFLYDLPHTSELPALPDTPDGFGLAGFEATYLGPSEQRDDGTYESTERKWFRLPLDLGDDVHLHTAYMGLASDWTGLGSRPLKMEFEETGHFPVASLDHALWFHRAPNVNEWCYLDLHSLVNYGGRGTLRETIRDTQGRVVASASQELLLR